jgi:outer membrane protein OmpA-like peptidoglycan-associated protein
MIRPKPLSNTRFSQFVIWSESVSLAPMQRHALILALVVSWSLLTAPLHLYAQTADSFTDLRHRAYTAADLAAALFPEAVLPMRGVGPRPPEPPPGRTAVTFDVNFEFNSATILPQHYSGLDKLGEVLAQHPQAAIEISGHTDNVGPDPYNDMLSQKRAEGIKRYLVQRFPVDAERLQAIGYGESQPRETNDTSEGRRFNRRVEVMRQR